jgi:four helix bundle protein
LSYQLSAVSSQCKKKEVVEMKNFRDLKVWEKAHRLTLDIYKATSAFPRDEQFGLTSQIKRSCTSIPANIAEGCGRRSNAELAHYLQIAMGSASELEYHLPLAHDLGFLQDTDHEYLDNITTEVKRMLSSFIKKLRADS